MFSAKVFYSDAINRSLQILIFAAMLSFVFLEFIFDVDLSYFVFERLRKTVLLQPRDKKLSKSCGDSKGKQKG